MHQRLAHREERLHGLGVLALVVQAVDLAAGVEEPVEELRERPADGVLRERRERGLLLFSVVLGSRAGPLRVSVL